MEELICSKSYYIFYSFHRSVILYTTLRFGCGYFILGAHYYSFLIDTVHFCQVRQSSVVSFIEIPFLFSGKLVLIDM